MENQQEDDHDVVEKEREAMDKIRAEMDRKEWSRAMDKIIDFLCEAYGPQTVKMWAAKYYLGISEPTSMTRLDKLCDRWISHYNGRYRCSHSTVRDEGLLSSQFSQEDIYRLEDAYMQYKKLNRQANPIRLAEYLTTKIDSDILEARAR